jgi:hypothetical protein
MPSELNLATARRLVTCEMPRLGWVGPRRLWLPGIHVHIVSPLAPPLNNVKKPNEVGFSSCSPILGIRLIHPSSALASFAMHATTGVRSPTVNFTRSIRRPSRATGGVSQPAAVACRRPPALVGSPPLA